MAFRSLGLLTILLLQWRSNASVIPFNGEANLEEIAMEDLKDLLLTSMQNTVSLNDLVTKLTEKIVDIMLTLGDTKAGMAQMEQTLSTEIEGLKNEITSIKATRDTDIENAKEGLAGVTNNVESLGSGIQELKEEVLEVSSACAENSTTEKIEEIKKNVDMVMSGVEDLVSKVAEVEDVAGTWPEGQYCILGSGGSCPTGFTRHHGYIRAIWQYNSVSDTYMRKAVFGDSSVGTHQVNNGNGWNADIYITACCK